jgi:hypothetical protein
MNIWGFMGQYGKEAFTVGAYLVLAGGYYFMSYKIKELKKETDENKKKIEKLIDDAIKHREQLVEHMSVIAASVAWIKGHMEAKQK